MSCKQPTKPCPGCSSPIPVHFTQANCVTCYVKEKKKMPIKSYLDGSK